MLGGATAYRTPPTARRPFTSFSPFLHFFFFIARWHRLVLGAPNSMGASVGRPGDTPIDGAVFAGGAAYL